ncbi:hypothetical protein PMI35_03753 [Pseudomonas sp. GM78]|nr:hypothetical protein PMI35_03753 [Pseudomonas sp. GM78]
MQRAAHALSCAAIESLEIPRPFRHFYDAKNQSVNFLTLVSLDFDHFFQ